MPQGEEDGDALVLEDDIEQARHSATEGPGESLRPEHHVLHAEESQECGNNALARGCREEVEGRMRSVSAVSALAP